MTARTQALPDVGEIVGGHYRLVRRLGEGMFGRVYVAERTDVPEHRVALKLMGRDMYTGRNVERELVMLAAASHPNIVQLKDHGMTDHYVWLSMPLYEGETLLERLERGRLTLREAHDIFVPIARGLSALHDKGLRHQDVKPENVYLARFNGSLHPVLLDLGVAVEKNAQFVAGTALYAAPEQLAALAGMGTGSGLDDKMDSYSIAATLLYALVGDDAYPGADALTPFAVASAFEEREKSPLRNGVLPDLIGEPRQQLRAALCRWLVRDQEQRPSASRLAEELDVLLAQERATARAVEEGIARQRLALKRVRVALGAVALILGSAMLYGFSKRETLRLAGELNRMRAEEKSSFDKLDTCVAAHAKSEQRVHDCGAQRASERQACERAVTQSEADGDAAELELARRVAAAQAKLATSEEDHKTAVASWEDTRIELETALADTGARATDLEHGLAAEKSRATMLEREIERESVTRQSCEASSIKLTQRHDECREDLAACIDERDTCMHAEPALALPRAATPPPAGAAGTPRPSGPDQSGAASAPQE